MSSGMSFMSFTAKRKTNIKGSSLRLKTRILHPQVLQTERKNKTFRTAI